MPQLPFTTLVSEIKQLATLYAKFVTYEYHLQQSLSDRGISIEAATGYLKYDPTNLAEARVRSMVRSFNMPNNQVICFEEKISVRACNFEVKQCPCDVILLALEVMKSTVKVCLMLYIYVRALICTIVECAYTLTPSYQSC
jgi:hypothetical protein